jgi:hypothetical protein
MTIHVRHIDDDTVEVTLTPSWLGRAFGAKLRRGIVVRDECVGYNCGSNETCRRQHWWWKATEVEVPHAIEREIECTTVEDLPRAEARRV